jgi:hypothetical protein
VLGWIPLESYQGCAMKFAWVLADDTIIDPSIDLEKLRNLGPLWGGWRTWRSYNTDNVVCHNESEARNLIDKNFHSRCNLHIPDKIYNAVNRPNGVKLYHGEFHELIDNPDEIVSMHLAASVSDILLLYGFNFKPLDPNADRLEKHKWHNYTQYFLNIVKSNPNTQWVVVDHGPEIEKEIKAIPNLQFDTIKTILST